MNYSEKIGALIKTSLVDFPGMVSTVIFLKSCNLRCPYCYNAPLVLNTEESENLVSFEDMLLHLKKRKNVLSGFVISGGEALLYPHLKELITKSKELGYKVKLDTNGTLPAKLEEIINNPLTKPDFIAMDIKTDPKKYSSLLTENHNNLMDFEKNIKKSISIIEKFPSSAREFRTVLVPSLIKKEDIGAIGKLIPKDSSWQFAQFINNNCLDSNYNNITPYTDSEMLELITYAKTFINNVKLR